MPGYRQPLSNGLPLYERKGAMLRLAHENRHPWYVDHVPHNHRWHGGGHYFDRPGFGTGCYNGGSLSTCRSQTPIGAAAQIRYGLT
ncbi:hypothetical protein [Bradyrhizobium cajani]|uniref:hypothetical protein n=1 Tax=Bradyrhizobium cajani TaxID=1928661 RepID=UPI001FEC026D|nr:hypothetical protein [Bradyrhizobium cajani]MCP3370913.1 hypothetical protein [Bradyrhizobium cajani]